MASMIQVRIDDDLKAKSDSLFKELGTDTTSAIRMFLTQAVANGGFPFAIKKNHTEQDPYESLSEEEFFIRLDMARKHAMEGKIRNADNVISDMREKYEL